MGAARATPHRQRLFTHNGIRVLAHWPNDRYIELVPKYWAATHLYQTAHLSPFPSLKMTASAARYASDFSDTTSDMLFLKSI